MKKLAKTGMTVLLTALSASAAAAPSAYSINSDSTSGNADSLYRIDLGAGTESRIATVKSLGETRLDVEGLALAPDGTLYGLDDAAMRLFPINTDNGVVQSANEVLIQGLPFGGGNDFGMTFICDGTLYATSSATGSLYEMDLQGNTQLVGSAGSLGAVKISALAAYGNQLYGLGNGADENGATDTPNLYTISLVDGTASLVGPIGVGAPGGPGPYLQGGLAFDDAGQLWAITEGALFGWASQVMKLDKTTGTASNIKNLGEQGFESLAITVPRGCDSGNEAIATFTVQKRYVDGNDDTPVTLNLLCNGGSEPGQSVTVQPNEGPFGEFEHNFVLETFGGVVGECTASEDPPEFYTPTYECFPQGSCSADATGCIFTDVAGGQENLCVIRNYPDPVDVTVTAEWLYNRPDLSGDDSVIVDLVCSNVFDGDGIRINGDMRWSWLFTSADVPQTATVYPDFEGNTACRTEVRNVNSAVESTSSCSGPVPVPLGAGTVDCLVSNTVFFEGIPTLGLPGLILAAAMLLLTGLVAVRRY